jgi:hypothetical protein
MVALLVTPSFYSPSNSKNDPQSNNQSSYLWPTQQNPPPQMQQLELSTQTSHMSTHNPVPAFVIRLNLVIQKTQHPPPPHHHNLVSKTPSPREWWIQWNIINWAFCDVFTTTEMYFIHFALTLRVSFYSVNICQSTHNVHISLLSFMLWSTSIFMVWTEFPQIHPN